MFEDWYEVVCHSETKPPGEWVNYLKTIKAALNGFIDRTKRPAGAVFPGSKSRMSTAAEGNVLESINMALNRFSRHYVDRNFTRTGLSVIVVSPGCGVLDVEPDLVEVTRQRVIDNGIACDMVCLVSAGGRAGGARCHVPTIARSCVPQPGASHRSPRC